jgi:hypothetical protein
MIEEDFPGLAPINFIQIQGTCLYIETPPLPLPDEKKGAAYLLPDTSTLCHEDAFAKVSLGWNRNGLAALVFVDQPLARTLYPEIQQGDSVELFIDTRDIKTSGYNTRFCHHFYFLPEAFEGHQAGEITRFRTEESHSHCDPTLLKIKTKSTKTGYLMQIFIPSECLHGYDPDQFDRIGFTYRINRPDGHSQHYTALSDEFRLEEQPSLWSSLKLIQ